MKLTSSQIKKLNKLANKKPIMVRVGHNWYTWYEGDPKHGVFLTTQSGDDVEFDFKQIDDIQESKMMKMKSKLREMIREEMLNEKKWDITQKTQGGTDFRNTMAFHSRELQKVVSLYKNRYKVDKEEMKYYMNIWIKGFHKRLKDLGVL